MQTNGHLNVIRLFFSRVKVDSALELTGDKTYPEVSREKPYPLLICSSTDSVNPDNVINAVKSAVQALNPTIAGQIKTPWYNCKIDNVSEKVGGIEVS